MGDGEREKEKNQEKIRWLLSRAIYLMQYFLWQWAVNQLKGGHGGHRAQEQCI